MGKTSKPLTIVALPPCDEWDELKRLEAQGHRVLRLAEHTALDGDAVAIILDADLIIGGNAWRMTTQHSKYLPVAIKEARMLRYDVKEQRQDVKNRKVADAEFGIGMHPDSGSGDVELPGD
jgi:hypothetical protein